MIVPLTDIELAAALLAVLLIGALAGTAGYVATVSRRQDRRITGLIEQLAGAAEPPDPRAIERIHDPRLRRGFEALARRVADAWALATTDPLTAISNRQAVLTRLEDEIERASRYQRHLSVVIIDIDHFKRLNDTFGHAAGDLVLHRVAQVLARSLRSVDVVGRYGGEEFMVVLPETDVDSAATIAEKLRRLVGREAVELEDVTLARVRGQEVIRLRGEAIPLVRLSELFQMPGVRGQETAAVVAEMGDRRAALAVDHLVAREQIVVKSFDAAAGTRPFFSGVTLLADGRPALVLDPMTVF